MLVDDDMIGCLTTTAATAPANLLTEMQLTLNSTKNQASTFGTRYIPLDAVYKQQKSGGKSSDQPAALKRRESSTKVQSQLTANYSTQ